MNKSLKELAQISYGKDYKSNPLGDKYPIYGTGGVMGYTSKALNFGPAVLSGRKGSINNPIYVEGGFWNVDTIYCLKPIGDTDPKWLFYNLLNTDLSKLNEATGVPSVSTQALNKLEFKYFEGGKQRKIAKILNTVDAVLEKTEVSIAKYKALKQGMMQDLFNRGIDPQTGKLRPIQKDAPELYKDTELGWIPKEWNVFKLKDKTGYVDYRGKTPTKSDQGVFLVTAKNIKEGYIDYDASKEYIPAKDYFLAMSRGIPQLGDVLITTEAPLGNVAQVDKAGIALAQRVIKYRGTSNEVDNSYLKYSFLSDYFQNGLYQESTGSTVLGIKGSRLHLQLIKLPQRLEQQVIANRLIKLDNLIENEQTNLSKHQSLKKGLMQDLLTGKVEVEV